MIPERVNAESVFKIESCQIMAVCSQHVGFFRRGHEHGTYGKRDDCTYGGKYDPFRNEIVRCQGGVSHENGQKHDGCGGYAGHKKIVKRGESPAPQGKPRKYHQKRHESGFAWKKQTYETCDDNAADASAYAVNRSSQGRKRRVDVETDAEGGERYPEALIHRIRPCGKLRNQH